MVRLVKVTAITAKASLECFQGGLAAFDMARARLISSGFIALGKRLEQDSLLPRLYLTAIRSPSDAHGNPNWDFKQHPLLKVARTYYPPGSKDNEAVLKALESTIVEFGLGQEDQFPGTGHHVRRWVQAGLRYGQELATQNPALVEEIFSENGPERLRDVQQLCLRITELAGGVNPVPLTREILNWHHATLGYRSPEIYGDALCRIIHVFEVSLWVSLIQQWKE